MITEIIYNFTKEIDEMIEREEMMTYYDNLMDWVERGHAFRIDLKTKSMQLLSNEKY